MVAGMEAQSHDSIPSLEGFYCFICVARVIIISNDDVDDL